MDYMRVGTTFYKTVRRPLVSGDSITEYVTWSVECIKQDHDKSFLASIPRYDGFCFVPNHLNYQKVIDQFYNRYSPFLHIPTPGYPKNTLVFLKHVFGEQLEIGLDYLKLLLLHPTQILPVLCLVSTEKQTGKTTFLNFLKAIFSDNMTLNSNQDFRSQFNAEWVHKLIIGVDEAFLQHKEDSERLKNLSTSMYYKTESKGFDRREIEFFGKFILCSNNEDNFIFMEPNEVRYWIRKLPPLQWDNIDLHNELVAEIPVFINYLVGRTFVTQPTTRMWFNIDEIATKALTRVRKYNRNKLEAEMAQILQGILDNREDARSICFCVSDMQDWLIRKGIRGYDSVSIRRVLQTDWKLQPSANSNSYQQYRLAVDGSIHESTQKGRFYKLSEKEVLRLNNLDDFDDNTINY
jgi:hypothetical protein